MRKSLFTCVGYLLILTLLTCGCRYTEADSSSVETVVMSATEATAQLTDPTDTPTEPTQPLPTEPPVTEPTATQPPATEPPVTEPAEEVTADSLLGKMTLEEKVGQLFLVAPEALIKTQPDGTGTAVTAVTDLVKAGLKEYPVGGIIMFGGNIVSPSQITALNNGLQAASDIPLFIAVDEEGGRVARIAKNTAFSVKKYESAAAVGAAGNAADGLEMGKTIGAYLHKYRFNLDFAPVGDVFTNPLNTVIGDRAFSTDAATAAMMAEAAAKGLKEQGIIPTYKHFPGHGDTAQDSHYQLAYTDKTVSEMLMCEWLPFMKATEKDCVMVGHIACPSITGDMTPATLSYTMVTQHLRFSCGFDGLVITDAMNMKAITDTYGAGNAAVMAIQAGCDIVLMPADLASAFDAVVKAVESGSISFERLNESVRRILEYKIEYGMIG